MTNGYITARDIYAYFQCPHWPYFDRHATAEERQLRRDFSPAELVRMENSVAEEYEIFEREFPGSTAVRIAATGDADADAAKTAELMAQGVPFIFHATIATGGRIAEPDLLVKTAGVSRWGDWMYAAVDLKSNHRVEKYQKMQHVLYATILEEMQGAMPAHGTVMTVDSECLDVVIADHLREFHEVIEELRRICDGERPEAVLRKSCFDGGPWGRACERIAVMNNDIALLYNVDIRRLRALRSCGVLTVADAAVMDPQALEGAAFGMSLHALDIMKRQAQSLEGKTVFVRDPIVFPEATTEIFFDIESDQPYDRDYLYGLLVRNAEGVRYTPILARSHDAEGEMWRAFLAWTAALPDQFVVYHFGRYEQSRLDVLEKRHGTAPSLARFRERMIDLQEHVSAAAIFPLYFYSLKHIANFLGFSWRGSIATGNQSIDVFEEFTRTRNEALLAELVEYNEDDVRATLFLKDWMNAFARTVTSYDPPYPWNGADGGDGADEGFRLSLRSR